MAFLKKQNPFIRKKDDISDLIPTNNSNKVKLNPDNYTGDIKNIINAHQRKQRLNKLYPSTKEFEFNTGFIGGTVPLPQFKAIKLLKTLKGIKNVPRIIKSGVEKGKELFKTNKLVIKDTGQYVGENFKKLGTGKKQLKEVKNGVAHYVSKKGSLDVLLTGANKSNQLGMYRTYSNKIPTNEWNFKAMLFDPKYKGKFKQILDPIIKNLPRNSVLTEKTSVSLGGLKVWNRFLTSGKFKQLLKNNKVSTTSVYLNDGSKSLSNYYSVSPKEIANTIEKIKNIYPGIRATGTSIKGQKNMIRIDLPKLTLK